MTCQELVEVVTDYFEGALSEEDRGRFDEHVADCDGCTIYLDQMRRTISMSGMLTEEQVSPQAKEELLAAFRDWKRAEGRA